MVPDSSQAGPSRGISPWRVTVTVLVVVAGAICAAVDYVLVTGYPIGVDAEIPLRAGERWLNGDEVYDPAAFAATGGPDLPYLYPPAVIPFLAPLTTLPRGGVIAVWLVITLLAAVVGLRRLALGWLPVAALLAWPPVLEAVLGGNVQTLLFATFVTVFFVASDAPGASSSDGSLRSSSPQPIDVGSDRRPAARIGALSAFIASLKVSHAHTWVHVLRARPRAALSGLVIALAVALATLPLTGWSLWADWLAQAGRSGDPTWEPVGIPLSVIVGRPMGLAITAATIAAAMLLRGPSAAAWVGLLTVVGSPALHRFGFMFLIPAMLAVPRPVALVVAALVAPGLREGAWLGVLLLALGLVLNQTRSPIADRRARRPLLHRTG